MVFYYDQARVLIQFLTHPHNVHILQHKRVIELGSGTGAVGLACAIHCAPLTSLLLTDLESVIVGITVPNIETVTKQHQQIEDMLSVDQLHAQSYPWYVLHSSGISLTANYFLGVQTQRF